VTRILRAAQLAICLLPLTAVAAPAQSTLGMGGVLCRDYLRAARGSDILYHQASQWLLGYVSGMNGALKAMNGSEGAIGVGSDQALKTAGTYCEANPASTLANAAQEWYAALPKQAAPQAEAKSSPKSGSLILNLDNAPSRKPLLDRH
jgi:hypothetical protein